MDLKIFRRLAPGINPELEVPWALARHTGFRAMAAPVAQAAYTSGDETCTLAVLQPFLPNRGDGWEWALRELRSAPDDAQCLAEALAQLGERTAELHLALASIGDDPAFAPEPVTAQDRAAWRRQLAAEAGAAAVELQQRGIAPELAARLAARDFATRFDLAGLETVRKVRVHGDYHLGQVLKTADDFAVLDFEGEPARSLEERRRKTCVLKDAAGMLRSFSYAARAAGAAPGWEHNARAAFWTRYETTLRLAPPALLPANPQACRHALAFFECEKAVYELRYELRHRPDWAAIPLAGLERLLED